MAEIESIIFDWGGVLIDNPRPGLMRYCAKALGVPAEQYTTVHNRFADDYQKALISEDVFWERVCGELKRPGPEASSLWGDAFRAVYAPRAEIFALASRLKANGYKTALLSNTEVPAMQFFREQRYDMFTTAVFSCEEGSMKPERRIYEITTVRLGSEPRQCVLIDDRPHFIEGAQQAGLEGIIYEDPAQVKRHLRLLSIEMD